MTAQELLALLVDDSSTLRDVLVMYRNEGAFGPPETYSDTIVEEAAETLLAGMRAEPVTEQELINRIKAQFQKEANLSYVDMEPGHKDVPRIGDAAEVYMDGAMSIDMMRLLVQLHDVRQGAT